MNPSLESKIEALLFMRAEPISKKELAKFCATTESAVAAALETLRERYNDRGVTLVTNGDEFTLSTSPSCSEFLEKLRKEELDRELSKASLETLAIILYKETPTRSEIDYIRGVNSTFILRSLSIRGLISKEVHPEDSRKFIYRPTLDLLRYLGIDSPNSLKDYESTNTRLKAVSQKEIEE